MSEVDACANSSGEKRQRKNSWRAEDCARPGPGIVAQILITIFNFLMSVESNSGPLGMGRKDNGGNEIELISGD
jgi:hypothetical protein